MHADGARRGRVSRLAGEWRRGGVGREGADDELGEELAASLRGGVVAANAFTEATAEVGAERDGSDVGLGLETSTPEDLAEGRADGEELMHNGEETGG